MINRQKDKKISQAARYVFKTGSEPKQLTAEALIGCQQIGIKEEALAQRNIDSFIEISGEPIELAKVRAEHYAQRRKCKLFSR